MALGLTVPRIAHLSDVHLLDRRAEHDLRCRFVSIQRPLDAALRAKRLVDALRLAVKSGAGHIVISGDLTEMGTPTEFEHFAEILHGSGIAPESITLIPGNHDVYTAPDAWRRALEGPLAAFKAASAEGPGKIVERGDLVLLPLDVTKYQSVARSGGELTEPWARAVEARLGDESLRKKAAVVVQHHPPFSNPKCPWHFIDGLAGYARMLAILGGHTHAQLLHGHTHQIADRLVPAPLQRVADGLRHAAANVVAPGAALARRILPRVFSAPATVEDEVGRPRVRLYDLRDGRLEAIGLAA